MGEGKKSWAQHVGTVDIGIYGSSGKEVKYIGMCGEDDAGGRERREEGGNYITRREMVALWAPSLRRDNEDGGRHDVVCIWVLAI